MKGPQRHDDRYAITTSNESPPDFLDEWKTGTVDEIIEEYRKACAATEKPGDKVNLFSAPVADPSLKRDGRVIVTVYTVDTFTRHTPATP